MTNVETAKVSTDRVVICMKWGSLYPASYVNVLFAAVQRNVSHPVRFVCLTDDPSGLTAGIEHFPIPDMGLEERHWKKGGWAKLSVFGKDLYGLTGRALFLDLDTVICSSLEPFFEADAPILTIDEGATWKNDPTAPQLSNTSVFAFTLGAEPEILEKFLANRDAMVAKYRIEQVYLQNEAKSVSFWPDPWVVSFKYHLRRPVGLGFFLPPSRPDPKTKIVAFHGVPRPIDLVQPGWWGQFPHVGRGKVDWMVKYWNGAKS
jgi:hypothetical protein